MPNRRKRHDGIELALFLPPHAAIRLPPQVTTELGRVDVVPNNMVEDLVEPGYGLMADLSAMELQVERPISFRDKDPDDSWVKRWIRERGY